MKVKLKKGIALANNWKSCGCTKENWDDLNAGKSIEVSSVPELIKDSLDGTESASKPKEKKQGGNK